MKHKSEELEGALLDAAVAKAEGFELLDLLDRLAAWRPDHRARGNLAYPVCRA